MPAFFKTAASIWNGTNLGQKISILSLILLLFVLPLALVSTASTTRLFGKAQAPTTTTLYFSPSDITSAPNNTVELTLGMSAGQENVAAAEIHINFDKNFIEAQNVEVSDFLPMRLQEPLIDNSAGKMSFILGNDLMEPRTGSGQIAKITFHTTSQTGQTAISFDRNMTKVVTLEQSTNVPLETMDAYLNIKP